MARRETVTLSLLAACVFCTVVLSGAGPIQEEHDGHLRHRRSTDQQPRVPTVANREKCNASDAAPSTRVNTTQRLEAMRAAMTSLGLDAFIVLSDDAHASEYPAARDLRRAFISGFTGSAGTAVVTLDKAALWTDGRYFLEAEGALDCNWILMKTGELGVPSLTTWLISELKDSNKTVGADPFLVSNSQWESFRSAFNLVNVTFRQLEAGQANPVDTAWGTNQPPPPNSTINALEIKYAGKPWQEKVADVIRAMKEKRITNGAHVVTALDEIAWLFNLRAKDIAYNPFFIAYAIIESSNNSNTTRLYIYDKDQRLQTQPDDPETLHNLTEHLNTNVNGSCSGVAGMCVEVLDYNGTKVVADIAEIANRSSDVMIWVTSACNYAIYQTIPQAQRLQQRSSIALAKAMKNPTEVAGMERGYARDSAVLIEFLALLEKDIKEGLKNWTEVSAAEKLKEMRENTTLNRGLSFGSISGSGPNGAIIHYDPSNATDRPLNTSEMYLLDSGGQYLDATTDVTRTFHYGTPTPYQIECYTRVLMGSIDLAMLVWPEGLYGREIDMAARAPLWEVGLEYRHGTGHGIGAFLSVHEGPGRISLTHALNPDDETLRPNMFFSDEPGFYEDGQFGIRLETVVMVEPRNTTHKFGTKQFLGFRPFTLVPFEPHLIDYSLLNHRQIKWLNDYHNKTQTAIEPLLTSEQARAWLRARTQPSVDQTTTPATTSTTPAISPSCPVSSASVNVISALPVCITIITASIIRH